MWCMHAFFVREFSIMQQCLARYMSSCLTSPDATSHVPFNMHVVLILTKQ